MHEQFAGDAKVGPYPGLTRETVRSAALVLNKGSQNPEDYEAAQYGFAELRPALGLVDSDEWLSKHMDAAREVYSVGYGLDFVPRAEVVRYFAILVSKPGYTQLDTQSRVGLLAEVASGAADSGMYTSFRKAQRAVDGVLAEDVRYKRTLGYEGAYHKSLELRAEYRKRAGLGAEGVKQALLLGGVAAAALMMRRRTE